MKANEESRPHHCETIDGSTSKSALIARLNDRFRRDGRGGTVAITSGVLAMGSVPAVMALVRAYDTFDADNDPYGERDFGSLDCGDVKLFWKIDYYDKAMQFGSPDPADADVTTRVLTVMLADEW